MNTKTITLLAGASLLPILAFGQTPPPPPVPPVPPIPPNPPAQSGQNFPGREHEKKVPVTWLGVETSEVPRVVSEQLGLANGFGLVVDFVVPESPAATAGVQQSDILKMLNDQILTEPGQLAKLVHSFSDGTSVTLTVLRKGAEQKLTVKLGKHDVQMRVNFGPHFDKHWMDGHGADLGALGEEMKNITGQITNAMPNLDLSSLRETVVNARRAAADARRRVDEQVRLVSRDGGAMKSTRIDLNKAQVVYSDDRGEMRIEKVNGKKQLTAKDGQGRLQFSGPVDTQEEVAKIPAEVRSRYEKLEHQDLPAIAPQSTAKPEAKSGTEDAAEDADDEDDDDDADEKTGGASGMQQVTNGSSMPRGTGSWTLTL